MDGVAVPIQLQEGNGMLVPSMQASQLARDRGDVKTTATIEFKCTQEDIDRAMRAKERIKINPRHRRWRTAYMHQHVDQRCRRVRSRTRMDGNFSQAQKKVRRHRN